MALFEPPCKHWIHDVNAHNEVIRPIMSSAEFVHACRGPLDLAPWLYVTPAELAPFRDLLLRLGAREAFGAAQYAAVLSAMAKRVGGQALDPTTLAQAISIIQVCARLPAATIILAAGSAGSSRLWPTRNALVFTACALTMTPRCIWGHTQGYAQTLLPCCPVVTATEQEVVLNF